MKPSLSTPVRVIKIGGSLLELPELTCRLEDWLTQQPPMLNFCIVGGGQPVQKIKDFARTIDSSKSHWAAIQQMDRHAISLSQTSQHWSFFDSPDSLQESLATTLNFIGMEAWLRNTIVCLPESWDVTSDSIAVVLARYLNSKELTLLKSTLPPRDKSLTQLIDMGFVDRYFETALTSAEDSQLSPLEQLKIVNFRDEKFAEQSLRRPCSN
ncbi:MAG: hypothetical protein P8R31_12045 [Mariniblastus sp.]|nr:hypothetical protein [Mariniblastus sp.]